MANIWVRIGLFVLEGCTHWPGKTKTWSKVRHWSQDRLYLTTRSTHFIYVIWQTYGLGLVYLFWRGVHTGMAKPKHGAKSDTGHRICFI